jgi:L-ascorbate metabolism protein UlaG (beta-lactamase superfamily)
MNGNDLAETVGFGKGGTLTLGGTKVTMVNAVHSASIDFGDRGLLPAGSAAGFMIAGEGHTIYVSGDTDIMADMAWMAEYHQPDIGILSCGGHYTMDMERAAWAARKWFNFRWVIPCHYKTSSRRCWTRSASDPCHDTRVFCENSACRTPSFRRKLVLRHKVQSSSSLPSASPPAPFRRVALKAMVTLSPPASFG